MAQPNDAGGTGAITFLAVLGTIAGGMNYEVAIGSLLGSFFFLSMPANVRGFRGFLLWCFSLGCGYSSGLYAYRAWSDAGGMLVALVMAGLGVGVMTALQKYVDGGPLPDFLERILDRVPFLKGKRGTTDV